MQAAMAAAGASGPVAAFHTAFSESQLARERRMWTLTLIEALPPDLRRRFALAAIVHCVRHWDDEDFRHWHLPYVESTLRTIATSLLERSVRGWRRNLKGYGDVRVQARLLAPRQRPGCTARIDHGGADVLVALPLEWFIEVWAQGIALVDDCFVLGSGSHAGDATWAHVIAIRFERTSRDKSRGVQAPAIVTRGANGEWSLRWL
jgi:hypothetical protein